MNISEQQVWLDAYCAALAGGHASRYLVAYADDAVKDFYKRFPKFRYASEENKDPK